MTQNEYSRKIRKWNLPLTYEPKIEAVKAGTCGQTIRIGNKYSAGDFVRFYTWLGRPYHSKRKTITGYMELKEVLPLKIFNNGISFPSSLGGIDSATWKDLDGLALRDGIAPPTGEALRNVLISKNGKIPAEGIEAQVIRWKP